MYGIRDLYIMLLVFFVVNFLALDKLIIWKLSMLSENFFWQQNQFLACENLMEWGVSSCRHTKYGSLEASGVSDARRMKFS